MPLQDRFYKTHWLANPCELYTLIKCFVAFPIAFENTATQQPRAMILAAFLLLWENTMAKSSDTR